MNVFLLDENSYLTLSYDTNCMPTTVFFLSVSLKGEGQKRNFKLLFQERKYQVIVNV